MFGLPPGMTATILLIVVSIIAIVVSIKLSNRHGDGLRWFITKSSSKVRSKVTAFVAFPFWIWAVYKVITKGDPDLGSITFLLVLISASLNVHCDDKNNNPGCVKKTAVFMLFSNVLLSLNYCLPLFTMKLPKTFYVYLVIGAVYWALMAIWNWKGHRAEMEKATAKVVTQECGNLV